MSVGCIFEGEGLIVSCHCLQACMGFQFMVVIFCLKHKMKNFSNVIRVSVPKGEHEVFSSRLLCLQGPGTLSFLHCLSLVPFSYLSSSALDLLYCPFFWCTKEYNNNPLSALSCASLCYNAHEKIYYISLKVDKQGTDKTYCLQGWMHHGLNVSLWMSPGTMC